MNRYVKRVLFSLAAITVAGVGAQIVYLRYFWSLGPIEIDWGLDKPRAIKAVDPLAREKLRVGMSAGDVRQLLGEAHSRVGVNSAECTGGCAVCEAAVSPVPWRSYWEYNWTDGLSLTGPSAKAYAVYFDGQEKVVFFRAPLADPP